MIHAYIPVELSKGLPPTALRVAPYLFACLILHGKQSPTGAQYWEASQKSLAKKFGVCRQTINRNVKLLHQRMIISKRARRRANGLWQTCMYKFGPEMVRIFKGAKAAIAAVVYHVACTRHIVIKTVNNLKYKGLKVELRSHPDKEKADREAYLASLSTKYGEGII